MQTYSSVPSKNGPDLNVNFLTDERGIYEVKLGLSNKNQGLKWHISGPSISLIFIELIKKWMDFYCKRRQSDIFLPLVLDGLSPYTRHVLTLLKDIPFGVSLSYKELAGITGNPHGARAVGNACRKNPFPLIIPCHRVLAAKNQIGGFSSGIEIKQNLLCFENISFIHKSKEV